MRKIAITAVLLFLSFTQPAFAEQTLRITNGEWAPYLSEHLPKNGFASDVVKVAFAAVGINVEYDFFPWRRSYMLARKGTWHGSVVWVHTRERAEDFHYSNTVVLDQEFLFHLKSFKLEWEQVEDLEGLTIGGTLHTVYPLFALAEARGLISIERSGTYENLYRRLLKYRIHAIPQVSQVGRYLISTTLTPEEQSRITFSPTVIQTREYALILSKAVPENALLIKKFNQGLNLIKSKGIYGKMLKALTTGAYDSGVPTQ